MPAVEQLSRGRVSTVAITTAMVAVIVLAVAVASFASNGAADRFLAKIRGQAPVERYDRMADAPDGTGPSWLPGSTSEVSIRTQEKKAGQGLGAVRIDGQLPADWTLPPDCKRTGYVQPWDGGGDWPLTVGTRISSCLDGEIEWNLFTEGSHVYLFRDSIRL